ncbi:hypothetical protein ES703_61686 [subsurface metagenome]
MTKIKFVITCLLAGLFVNVLAQDQLLDAYIQQGLQSNLALQQIKADYSKSLQSLRSARGLFYPDVSLNARYTTSRGGRVIEFPVGDLLNPVYNTLNQLTQSNDFSEVENAEFRFYRPIEHETKLSLIQPVFNPQVIYNYQIEKEKVNIEAGNITIYKRELIKEIKLAYYNYLTTLYLLKLVDETDDLLTENLRVSKSLYENDKVTLDVVYRSEAELQKVYLGQAEAEKANQSAKAYFNFLLNKSLDSEIQVPEEGEIPEILLVSDIEKEIDSGINSREEINQLQSYAIINEKYTNLARSSNYPNLFLALNYGFQGAEYSFTSQDDFMLASVVLQWNLFQGFKNRADVQRAKIVSEQIDRRQEELEKQIELQVINAYYDLAAAVKAIDAAQIQVQASGKAFRVVNEKFRIGQAQLIEYTDARATMTKSKQNLIIAVFGYKIKKAELERATAEIGIDY